MSELAPWLPADVDAPCAGKWLLFEAVEWRYHAQAKKHCDACPIRRQCLEQARTERSRGGIPIGTWGGVLFGGTNKDVDLAIEADRIERDWTFEDARTASAGWKRGEHTPYNLAGRRAYERIRANRRRAAA